MAGPGDEEREADERGDAEMMEIKNLSAAYGSMQVLSDISAVFPSGEVTVVVGPNGSGKSTLMKIAANIMAPLSGEILADGRPLSEMSPREAARRVAYLPQVRDVPDLTVERMVLHGRFPHMGFPRRYGNEDRAIVEEVLTETGLAQLRDRPVRTLSGGQRQKAYLAMALAQGSDIVLLDEPTAFLDISHQLETVSMVRSLAKAGRTVVMVLHDLPAAMDAADRIVVLSGGYLAGSGTPEEVFCSKIIPEVFGISFERTAAENGWRYYCEKR